MSTKLQNPFFTYEDLLPIVRIPDPQYLAPTLLCQCLEGKRKYSAVFLSSLVLEGLKKVARYVRGGEHHKLGTRLHIDTIASAVARGDGNAYRRALTQLWLILQCSSCVRRPLDEPPNISAEIELRYESEIQEWHRGIKECYENDLRDVRVHTRTGRGIKIGWKDLISIIKLDPTNERQVKKTPRLCLHPNTFLEMADGEEIEKEMYKVLYFYNSGESYWYSNLKAIYIRFICDKCRLGMQTTKIGQGMDSKTSEWAKSIEKRTVQLTGDQSSPWITLDAEKSLLNSPKYVMNAEDVRMVTLKHDKVHKVTQVYRSEKLAKGRFCKDEDLLRELRRRLLHSSDGQIVTKFYGLVKEVERTMGRNEGGGIGEPDGYYGGAGQQDDDDSSGEIYAGGPGSRS